MLSSNLNIKKDLGTSPSSRHDRENLVSWTSSGPQGAFEIIYSTDPPKQILILYEGFFQPISEMGTSDGSLKPAKFSSEVDLKYSKVDESPSLSRERVVSPSFLTASKSRLKALPKSAFQSNTSFLDEQGKM